MRIGVLIDRWAPGRGGAERSLAGLRDVLVQRGHEVQFHALSGPPGEFVQVRAPGLTRAARARALSRALVWSAARAGCDAMLAIRHVASVDVLWLHGGSHRVSVRAKREAAHGRPLTDVPLRGRHAALQALEDAALAGGARLVIAPSAATARELAPTGGTRVEVVENGVDLARFQPGAREAAARRLRALAGVTDDRPLLVLPARDPRLKGAGALALAAARLGPRPLALIVAGPRHAARWQRRLARSARPNPGVVVRVLPHADGLDLAAGATLAVHPTWRDTSSLATLEALASGTPVVATRRNPAAAEREGRPGVTCAEDPADVDGLAARISEALGSTLDPDDVRCAAAVPDAAAALGRVADLVLEAARARRG